MGKGLAAATGTAQAKFMLRALLLEGHPPTEALARLNRHLHRDGAGDADPVGTPFVAVAVAVVDLEPGHATFAVAGAEAPLVARPDGTVQAVRSGGLPLGVLPDWEQGGPTAPVPLRSGSLVALYTDGLTEARAAGGEPFGAERVEAVLAEAAGLASPADVGGLLVGRARRWAGGAQQDDVCLLVARVSPPSRSSVVVRRV